MKVHVLGDGLLADTTRSCLRHGLTDIQPDIMWVCIDTPIVDGHGDHHAVRAAIDEALPDVNPTLTLVSSPVPVGFCAGLEARWPDREFAVSPENIRRHHPIGDFLHQRRVVIGARRFIPEIAELLTPFCARLLWMTPESAEMAKHALNAYLAVCVRFGNEIGALCEQVGANPVDVLRALQAEPRVSEVAPLAPGPGPSEHLLRDVNSLVGFGAGPVIRALR